MREFLQRLTLGIGDLVELAGDVVVHAAEVELIEHLRAAFSQPLEHLAQAFEPVAFRIGEALLHEPAQRRIEIAVIQQIVGHLGEQAVRVEVEAGLGAVPGRVFEARAFPASPAPPDLHWLAPSGRSAAERFGIPTRSPMCITLSWQRSLRVQPLNHGSGRWPGRRRALC